MAPESFVTEVQQQAVLFLTINNAIDIKSTLDINQMKGYLTNDAVLHAPESRTSSPISIPRNPETLEHIEIAGLYPCAEGAGYAGGIISAAIDGMKCVDAINEKMKHEKV